MKTFIFLVPALLAAAPALAGVTMKMENVSDYKGQPSKSSYVNYIEPEYSRLEMSVNYQDPEKKGTSTQKSVIITRLDKKVVWTLMPAANGYCEFTFDELRKSMNSGSGLVPDGAAPAGFTYKKTSGSKKIAGFASDEYAFSGKDLKGKAWITDDAKLKPAADFYRGQAAALGLSGGKDAPGVLMGHEASAKDSSHVMTVRSVKTGDIPAEKFALPADYKRLNASAWNEYRKNFDTKMIMEQVKKRLAEEARSRAKAAASEKGKDAVKKGIKGLVGF
ncbi:MAG: hypothetical protein FD189_1574 [Elusimicrobia bacterium]|nr:MAG: hypothetical protein FD154_1809 [Elusimicrobiota bacterium]KAF0155063.1 MAG: hypothetical protein FD189_1574 [Elusimicrobiota bacterium]